ncbi:MAG: hypothetical protein HQK51_09530 [Oligoflexia bacterium]|nr:hypothetical protein [Oligoflexia bacterium]
MMRNNNPFRRSLFFFLLLIPSLFINDSMGVTKMIKGEGGMISTGVDGYTNEYNPYFIGTEAVRYCIIKSNNFSRDLEDIKKDISNALSEWKDAIALIKPEPIPSNRRFPVGVQGKNLSTNFIYEESCKNDTELIFYLGEMNSSIRKVLSERAKYVLGFAKKILSNENTGRAKGYIWLAPDRGPDKYDYPKSAIDFWSNNTIYSNAYNYNFHNVIQHELGHIFGVHHSEAEARSLAQTSTFRESALIPLDWMVQRYVWHLGNVRCGHWYELSSSLRDLMKVPNNVGARFDSKEKYGILCMKAGFDRTGTTVLPVGIRFFQEDKKSGVIEPLTTITFNQILPPSSSTLIMSGALVTNNGAESIGYYGIDFQFSSDTRHAFFQSRDFIAGPHANFQWAFYDSKGNKIRSLPVVIKIMGSTVAINPVLDNNFAVLNAYSIDPSILKLQKELELTW